MSDNQIDPVLLELEDQPIGAGGRGSKRKARTSSSNVAAAAEGSTRVSTRLAGKSTSSLPAGTGGGGKGGEPARGEEENLNKLRGGVSLFDLYIVVFGKRRANRIETTKRERWICIEITSEETYESPFQEGQGEGRNIRNRWISRSSFGLRVTCYCLSYPVLCNVELI